MSGHNAGLKSPRSVSSEKGRKMQFTQTPLDGAFLIDLEKREDSRGFFARMFCPREFEQHGLRPSLAQINTAMSFEKGTLRGMHYQLPPHAEIKVVKCLRGAVHDVILDLRPDSATFGTWFGAELNDDNRRMMYIPEGFGHGYYSLTDNAELLYLTTEFYSPESERTIRWDDPKFGIEWPGEPAVISEKDAAARDFDLAYHLVAAAETDE